MRDGSDSSTANTRKMDMFFKQFCLFFVQFHEIFVIKCKQNKLSNYIFNFFLSTTKISWNCTKFGWTPRSVTNTMNLLAVVADVVDDHGGVVVVVSLELQPPRRPRGNFGQVEGGTKKWTRTFFGGSFKAVRNFLQLLHGVWSETKSEAIFTQIPFIFTKFL